MWNGPLPPGAKYEDGELVRYIPGTSASGKPYPRRRVVASTLVEARESGNDYYDPQKGWILYGRKMQREHFMLEDEEPITQRAPQEVFANMPEVQQQVDPAKLQEGEEYLKQSLALAPVHTPKGK